MSLHGFQSAIIDKTKHRPVKLKNIQPLCILMCILTIPEIAHAAKFDHKAVFTSPCLDIMTSSIPDPDLTKFTVCTYIKLASSDPWTAFTYQLPNSSVYEFGVFGDSSSLTIWMFGTQINVIEKLNLQTWYEICIMWDGDSKSMGFYLDGTQKVRRKLENNHKLAGGGGVFLGCPQNKEANSSISVGLVGEIYMFRMWNSVQSSLLQTCKDGTVIQWKTEKWIYYTNVIQRDSTLHCAKEQEYSSMSGQINNIIHLFHKRSLGEISNGVRQPAEGVTSRPSLVFPNVSPTISSTTGTKVLTSGMNTISVVETTNITNVTGFTIGTSRSKTIWTSSSLNNENDTFTNSSTFSTSSFTTTMNNGTSSWSTGITSKRTYVTSEFSQTTNVVNNETFTTPSISSDMAAGSMNCSMNDTLAAETWLLDICKSSCDYGSAYEIILNENCTEEESKLKLKLTILNFNYFGKNCKVLVLNNTAINDCDLWKRSSSGINIQGVNRIDYYCCCSEECPSPNCIMSKRICLTDGTGVTKGFSSTVLDNSDLTIGVTVNNRTGMTDYSGASTTSTKGSSTMINSTSLTTLSIVSNSSVGIGLSTDSILNTTLKGEVTLTGNGQSKTTPNSESTPSNGGSNATHSHGTTASADSESNTTADQATMTTINGTANTGSDITGNSGHTPSADSGSRTTANSESTRTTNSGSNSTYNPGRTTTVNNGFSTAGNSESTRTTNSGSNSTYNPGRTTTVNNGFSTAGNSESTRTTNSGSNSTYNPGRTTTINDGFSTAGDGGVNITAGGDTWTRNTTVNTGSTTTSQSGSKTTYTYNHTVTISGGSSSSDNVTNSPNTTDSSKNVTIILPGPDDLNSSAIDRILSQLESMLRGEVSVSDAQAMLNTLDVLLSANQTLLGPVANSLIKVVDTIGLQLAFPGNNISLTSNFLALAVEKVNVSSFTGTSFGVDSSSGLQVSWGAQAPGNSDGSVLLPASVISQLSPDEKKNASRVQFNYYAKTSLFMDSSLTTKQLVSKVISSSVSNLSISNLTESIVVTLKTSPTNSSNQVSCVFWDFNRNNGSGGWSSEGCSVAKTTRDETVCKCNHLTSFAILMNVSPNAQLKPEDLLVLTFITYIGCGLSAIFLSVTLVTYIAFEKIRRDYPSKILIQLCAALVCLNLTFLLNPWIALYNDIPGLCISVAAFLHYFVLVSITWMGLEAFHMYLSLVKVFNTYVRKYILKFCIVGWGVPAVVVAIILAVNKDLYSLKISGKYPNGSTDYFCWVNDTVFWVTVVGYFAIIFLLNVSMFVVVLIQLCRIKKQKQLGYQRKTTLQDLRSVAGITFLLGITWGLGFFSFGPGTTVVMFLFTIFNSLQGFFIFFFYCVAKENVRKQWRRYLCCGKFRLAENSDWSKTATNKLRKQTSKQGVSSSSSNSIQSSSNTNSTTLLVSSEYSLHPNGNGNVLKERNGVSFMLQNGEMPLQEMAARASTKNGNVKQNSLRRTSNRGSVHFIDQI